MGRALSDAAATGLNLNGVARLAANGVEVSFACLASGSVGGCERRFEAAIDERRVSVRERKRVHFLTYTNSTAKF